MNNSTTIAKKGIAGRSHQKPTEPLPVRVALILTAVLFLGFFLVLPLAVIFHEAFQSGARAYFEALRNPNALASVRLTLLTAAICVPVNCLFGLMAAWAITKFQFWGKSLLITIIDLPFAVSPVISGLIFVLLFGQRGLLGPWLDLHNIKIIFAVPGIILVTAFVTFPFVAREIIPLMQAQGSDEEQAAISLGASGFQTFRRITFPNIKLGLLYGVILCNARAMGEFGAVYVVSSRIAGLTNTMPLEIDSLYQDTNFVGLFSVASLLAMLALVTLVAKNIIEWVARRQSETPSDSEIAEEKP